MHTHAAEVDPFPLTRAALAAYDEANAAFDPTGPIDDPAAVLANLAALRTAVGEAFAADTADRNDPAVARTIGPEGDWLRGVLERHPAAVVAQ